MIKPLKPFLRRQVRRFMNYSLRTKIILAFLLIALVPIGTLAYLNYRTTRSALAQSANQALFAAASRTAASIDSFIDATLDIVHTASQLPDLEAYLRMAPEQRAGSELEDHALDILLALSRRRDTFYVVSYGLLDADGQNVLDTLPSNVGRDESDRIYFQATSKTGQSYVSPVQFPRESGTVSFYFCSPIRRDTIGEVIGLLRVQYTMAMLQQLVFESEGLAGEKSSAILLDENHLFLAHSAAPELLFKSVVPLEPERVAELQMSRRFPSRPRTEPSADLAAFEQGLNRADNPSFFAARTHPDAAGLEQVAVVRLRTQPWLVAFVQPQQVFLEPVNAQARTTLGLAVVIAIVVAAVAVTLARLLTRPITRLTVVAEQVAAGDLTARAHPQFDDEIGKLARTFDTMTARLRRTLEGLERRNRQLHQEIGERRRAEAEREALITELETKNAELERFVYTVSHDLKSPLITIRGFLGFVEQAALAGDVEQVKVDMTRIVAATDKMHQLLGELLELSRIGRLMNRPEEVAMGELVLEAVDLVQGWLEKRGVEVAIAPDLSVVDGPTVYGDRARLTEVWQNLLDNAVKFMGDQPHPRIELGMRKDSEEAVFFVRDNGIGVDPRYQERVFNLFEKLDPNVEGTGVGLAIVKRIVEVHGGRIWIESEGIGHGSAFCFTLPDGPGSEDLE